VAWLLTGCGRPAPGRLQGYLEGEYVYVASPYAGTLEKLWVQRGVQVQAKGLLFTLDNTPERTARDEAEHRLNQARASLDDARKGMRSSELESIGASRQQAEAALRLSEKELAREEQLLKDNGATTEQSVDRARSIRDQDRQRLAKLVADLETAKSGARSDQLAALEANVLGMEAGLARAEWNLAQKSQSAERAGLVFDTLYREGEWVSAGRPVVVLLPPENIKLRVYLPEGRLGSLQIGDPVRVYIDGVDGSVPGTVSFISPQAEYSPPMVYSRENRHKFVYLVEARFAPDVAPKLHPGQPVDVEVSSRQP
jgi:HlyD family secretion protein